MLFRDIFSPPRIRSATAFTPATHLGPPGNSHADFFTHLLSATQAKLPRRWCLLCPCTCRTAGRDRVAASFSRFSPGPASFFAATITWAQSLSHPLSSASDTLCCASFAPPAIPTGIGPRSTAAVLHSRHYRAVQTPLALARAFF